MKSTGNTRAIIVGIFVFLGVAIFIITVLTLGSQHKTFERSITVKTFFENVNGLQKGNNVWFSGVKVGTIRKVNLKENGQVEVEMNIEEVSVKFIPKDVKAKLSSDGLIGNKIIEIYGGTPNGAKIEEGDIVGSDKLLSTDAMMNTLSKNNDNILAITNDFKLISSRIAAGKGSIGKLLTDETMVDQLNATTNILKRASENLEKLSANVSAYTAKLNNKGSLANDLVTDTVIFAKLRATVSQLQNVADSSQGVIANLKTTGNIINNGLNNKNTPAGMLLNDDQSANKIKITLQNLQSASKKLDDDLEALQHNFLLRGFFKKKAKQDKENSKTILDTVVTN
ncbi:MAG TPA: MlaD family protein [Ginsengibacter sp.]|jgi:phospholipid/cholesterol/gamma-HCH transport system substrate-binding protein